jgi:hypothetical protein
MKKVVVITLIAFAVTLTAYAYSKYSGTGGGRTDSDYHNNGNVQLCICSGLYEHQSGEWPSNTWLYPFSYSGNYYLYESGIWVGTDCQGAVEVSESTHNGGEYHSVVELVMSDTGPWPDGVPLFADLDSYERCDDSDAGEAGPIGIEVERHGYSFSAPPKDDFIGFQYKIYNLSGSDLSNVYVSRFADFDLGGSASDNIDDLVGFDQDRQMPYMYDEDGDPPGYISTICPQGTPLGSKAYVSTPGDDAGKFQYMQYSDWDVKKTPDDWRVTYNTGPYFIPVDGYITIAFITVSGDDLADLQANADVAMDSYPGDTATVNITPASVGRVKALYR